MEQSCLLFQGISAEDRLKLVFQVQVVFWFLQCQDLLEARTSLQPNLGSDDETTYL